MAGNNFTNQWNNQALQAKRLENVLGWDYPSQTQQIIAQHRLRPHPLPPRTLIRLKIDLNQQSTKLPPPIL